MKNPFCRSLLRTSIYSVALLCSPALLFSQSLLTSARGPLAAATAPWTLYVTGGGTGPGAQFAALYTVNTATGEATVAWQFPIHIENGGLAYDEATDTMYATGALDSDPGTSRLFIINRFTGAWTAFPGMDPTFSISSGGLAISPLTGLMYAVGDSGMQSTALFTIDKATGAATFIGQTTGAFPTRLYGLGFRSDGALYANGYDFSSSDSQLFTVSLANGAATALGPHGITLGRQLRYSGLAFGDSGILYSLGSISTSTSGLYSVNPATGAATLIGSTSAQFGVDGGLTFAPACLTFANWKKAYFTQQEIDDPAISSDAADPDHDGLSNLLEYALHSDPRQSSSRNGPYALIDSSYFSVVYTKVLAACDLTYSVEQSTNLTQWSVASPTNVILADDQVTQTIKAQVTIPQPPPNASNRLFLRPSVSH
jgi:hypothetical protein